MPELRGDVSHLIRMEWLGGHRAVCSCGWHSMPCDNLDAAEQEAHIHRVTTAPLLPDDAAKPLSDERLAQMEGRPWPRTPGPWDARRTAAHPSDVLTLSVDAGDDYLVICEHAGDDAAFIAAAPEIRADLAAALDDLARVKAENGRLREAMNTALAAMRASAYVGGPTEREAWRTALDALSPYETHHASAALPPATRDAVLRRAGGGV